MSILTISVEPDGDGVWQIHANIETEAFKGRGWCWGSPEQIATFAAQLNAYPMPANDIAALRLGMDQRVGDDLRLVISICPQGSLGSLEARIEVADYHHPQFRVRAGMSISYDERDRFARQLTRIAKEEALVATLNGN